MVIDHISQYINHISNMVIKNLGSKKKDRSRLNHRFNIFSISLLNWQLKSSQSQSPYFNIGIIKPHTSQWVMINLMCQLG